MMPVRLFLFLLLALGSAAIASEEVRFSKTLSPAEFTATGLERISSDELAVLDALIRRDWTQAQFVTKQPRAARFSERLSADERRNAGLEHLAAEELARLDTHVQGRITPPASFDSATGSGSAALGVQSVKLRRDPEVHGSVSLMVAAGSDGYRAYGGALEVHYDDPANRYSVGIAVSQIHEKGRFYPGYWDGCYLYNRPYSRPFGPRW